MGWDKDNLGAPGGSSWRNLGIRKALQDSDMVGMPLQHLWAFERLHARTVEVWL